MVKRIARMSAMHRVLSDKAATSHHQPMERGYGMRDGLPEGDAEVCGGWMVDMEFGLLILEGDPVTDEVGETDWREDGWLEGKASSAIAKLSKDSRPPATKGSDASDP
jgi:hypothetical protein